MHTHVNLSAQCLYVCMIDKAIQPIVTTCMPVFRGRKRCIAIDWFGHWSALTRVVSSRSRRCRLDRFYRWPALQRCFHATSLDGYWFVVNEREDNDDDRQTDGQVDGPCADVTRCCTTLRRKDWVNDRVLYGLKNIMTVAHTSLRAAQVQQLARHQMISSDAFDRRYHPGLLSP